MPSFVPLLIQLAMISSAWLVAFCSCFSVAILMRFPPVTVGSLQSLTGVVKQLKLSFQPFPRRGTLDGLWLQTSDYFLSFRDWCAGLTPFGIQVSLVHQ